MGDRVRRIFHAFHCNSDYINLLFLWLAGLVCGGVFATLFGEDSHRAFHYAAGLRVSIPLLAAELLPFVICAFCAYRGRVLPIYITGFIKAAILTNGVYNAYAAFGTAGWLVQPLLQFSTLLLTPLFCWFAIRCVRGNNTVLRDLSVCILCWIAIVSFDFIFVSPFLAMLIEH